MRKARIQKIILNGYGSILRMEKGCYVVQDTKEKKIKKYPVFDAEIGEVVLKSGNTVTVGALASLSFWEIDTMIMTRRGKPIAMLKSLEYDTHVKTRLCQYEAYNNHKAFYIAKQIVTAKIRGQNTVLMKHGLETIHSRMEDFEDRVNHIKTDNLMLLRKKLLAIEYQYTKNYFNQIFQLFPKWLKPEVRRTWKAYDGLNNTFNLAYEILKWKVHIALIKAKLEPYLGFLHSLQRSMPSMVCDFQELYRYLIDNFLIAYCKELRKKDFTIKMMNFSNKRKGKRQFLRDSKAKVLVDSLYKYFTRIVEIPRIRRGQKQKMETLINEEALLFAKYLRGERETWIPRIAGF